MFLAEDLEEVCVLLAGEEVAESTLDMLADMVEKMKRRLASGRVVGRILEACLGNVACHDPALEVSEVILEIMQKQVEAAVRKVAAEQAEKAQQELMEVGGCLMAVNMRELHIRVGERHRFCPPPPPPPSSLRCSME